MKNQKLNFKNLNLILIFILPITFLAFGIKKQNELHEKLMIQGIGIDFDNENYNLTVQAYDYKNPEDKNEPKNRLIECSGKTVSEALENLKKITGLYPLYSQNKIVVFGSEVAKKGLNKIIDFFSRYYENRPSVKLRVAKDKASDIMKFEVEKKIIKSTEIRDLVNEKNDTNILDFEKELKTKISDPTLMVIEKSENKNLQCECASIFYDDKMVKILDKDETLALQVLKNASNIGVYTFFIDDRKISCKIENANSKIKVKLENENPHFDINIKISANILESEKKFEDIKSLETEVKNTLDENIKNNCEKVISNTISQGIDLFKFGKILRNKIPNYFKLVENDWKTNEINKINFDIKVNSKISMVGTDI